MTMWPKFALLLGSVLIVSGANAQAEGIILDSSAKVAQNEPGSGVNSMPGHGGPGMMGKPMMGQRAQQRFAELDGNGDGAIERDEFTGRHEAMIDFLDTNEDGSVTREEFINAPHPMPADGVRFQQGLERRAARFNQLDRDHDGELTAEEFRASGEQAFKFHDLNDDGKLTPDELGRGPRFAQ
jgi:EF hand